MEPILFIGGGNMARAIIEGATRVGVVNPASVVVVEPDASRRSSFAHAVADVRAGLDVLQHMENTPASGRIMLAVKPQKLAEVGEALGPLISDHPRCILSILAGTTIARLNDAIGEQHRFVRTMPNTPARIGRGMSAIAGGDTASTDDLAFARELFSSLGQVIEIDESMMDAFTAVAGSGPAYAFVLAEAMTRAAQDMGFTELQARLMVSETIAGAGLLLAQGDRDAEALRIAVTSPGGTTAAALEVMNDAGLEDAIMRALIAARDRGAELARM